MVNGNHILFSGYARLPAGTVSGEIYRVMALVVLIDRRTHTVMEADCTLSTRMAEKFVTRLLIGKNLRNDPEKLIQLLNDVYQGSARKALVMAIRSIHDKYLAFLNQNNAGLVP